METTAGHESGSVSPSPTATGTLRTLRSLLTRRRTTEDTGYAPRRLSSPSVWSRVVAIFQFLICHSRTPDNRGFQLEQLERERRQLPSLVEAGRHAGRSRVIFSERHINLHLWMRDYFITIVQNKTRVLILAFFLLYQAIYWFWGSMYYLLVKYHPGCLYGADTFVEAWVFAVITQTTIGYGNTGPQNCWAASWMIVIQGTLSVLLTAVVVGIMFARISHPHYRGRSIYMGDRAIVARRDGVLKLMFRIADIRRTQVVEPHVKAFLYTWGAGRMTAEGERIPVRCEALNIGYIDGMMLLPLTIEHTIDERSPLCGHTHDSLTGLNAEIVVTFEGTTEIGNPFMARRSYLPHEIHWGEQFCPILTKPDPGAREKVYGVDLTHFHDIRRQKDMPPATRSEASRNVVTRALKTVPYPLLGENTLAVSDCLCISAIPGSRDLELSVRVGDTYPNQMVEIAVQVILYRWTPLDVVRAEPLTPTFREYRLAVGYKDGSDRLNLRLPVEVKHRIDDASPLAHWRDKGGNAQDLDSEIVVIFNGYRTRSAENIMRQRTYVLGQHVRWGYRFVPIVRPPSVTSDGKVKIRWGKFHNVAMDTRRGPDGKILDVPGGTRFRITRTTRRQSEKELTSRAPESHAPRRAQAAHDSPENTAGVDLQSSAALARWASQGLQANDSSVMTNASGGMPGVEASDYTVMPMDLQRYATEIATLSLLPARSLRRPRLPRFLSRRDSSSAAVTPRASQAGPMSPPGTGAGAWDAAAAAPAGSGFASSGFTSPVLAGSGPPDSELAGSGPSDSGLADSKLATSPTVTLQRMSPFDMLRSGSLEVGTAEAPREGAVPDSTSPTTGSGLVPTPTSSDARAVSSAPRPVGGWPGSSARPPLSSVGTGSQGWSRASEGLPGVLSPLGRRGPPLPRRKAGTPGTTQPGSMPVSIAAADTPSGSASFNGGGGVSPTSGSGGGVSSTIGLDASSTIGIDASSSTGGMHSGALGSVPEESPVLGDQATRDESATATLDAGVAPGFGNAAASSFDARGPEDDPGDDATVEEQLARNLRRASTWQQQRALRNLFGDESSPPS